MSFNSKNSHEFYLWFTKIGEHEYGLKYSSMKDRFEIWRDDFLFAWYVEKIKAWVAQLDGKITTIEWPSFKDIVSEANEKLGVN